MTSRAAPLLLCLVTLIASLVGSASAEAADVPSRIHKPVRIVVNSSYERPAPGYVCYGGWLQTLDWGRVRPRYRVWCRVVD
jgi:hypothetical protein